jgi:hypothetical protein
MATTVHLPPDLLERIDGRAAALEVSRNRLVVETLSAALDDDGDWSPELLAVLHQPLGPESAALLDEMSVAILRSRTRKAPVDLG